MNIGFLLGRFVTQVRLHCFVEPDIDPIAYILIHYRRRFALESMLLYGVNLRLFGVFHYT